MLSILLNEGHRDDYYHEFALALGGEPIEQRKKLAKLSKRQRAKRLATRAAGMDFQDLLEVRSWIRDVGL